MAIKYQIDPTCGLFPTRFYVCFIAWIGLTINYVMRFSIGIVITEMVKPLKGKVDPNACPGEDGPPKMPKDTSNLLEWDEKLQGIILGSFFWGYIAFMIPGGMLGDYFGPRRVIFLSGLVSALLTILSPISVYKGGYGAFIAVRILLGVAQSVFYAPLHTLVAKWVPLQERGFWGTLVFSGAHMGNFLSNIASASMLDAFGSQWDLVFYIWGGCGAIWALIFFFTTYENYTDIPNITEKEKKVLDDYYDAVSKKNKVVTTPWKDIFLSWPVWAIIWAMIGHTWGVFILAVDLPKYMKSVLKFNVKANGTYVALGFLALCVCAYATGYVVDLIDKKKWLSKTWNRILFTTIASVGQSVAIIITNYMHCNRVMAVAFLVVGMCLTGTFYPSLKVNPIDLSPNHAGTIGAIAHGIGGLSGVFVPWVVGLMTPNATWSEWTMVWWLTFGIKTVTNVFYIFTASGEIQPWNSKGFPEEAKPNP